MTDLWHHYSMHALIKKKSEVTPSPEGPASTTKQTTQHILCAVVECELNWDQIW